MKAWMVFILGWVLIFGSVFIRIPKAGAEKVDREFLKVQMGLSKLNDAAATDDAIAAVDDVLNNLTVSPAGYAGFDNTQKPIVRTALEDAQEILASEEIRSDWRQVLDNLLSTVDETMSEVAHKNERTGVVFLGPFALIGFLMVFFSFSVMILVLDQTEG